MQGLEEVNLIKRRLMAQALSRQWGWKEEATPPCPTFSAMCTSELTSWVCSDRAGRVNGAEPEALMNSMAIEGGGGGRGWRLPEVPPPASRCPLLMRHGRPNSLHLGRELIWHALSWRCPLQSPYTTSPDPFCSGSPSSCGLAASQLWLCLFRAFSPWIVTSPSLFLLL